MIMEVKNQLIKIIFIQKGNTRWKYDYVRILRYEISRKNYIYKKKYIYY